MPNTYTLKIGTGESPSGVTPDLEEDFSTYTSTDNLLSDPRDIYLLSEDGRTERMTLDTSIGYSDSTQSLRYNYPIGTDTDYTISRTIGLESGTTEVWVEAAVRFSTDFTVNGNGQAGASALKLLLTGVNGVSGRFGIGFNNGDTGQVNAEGPSDAYQDFFLAGSTQPQSLYDENWHIIRHHMRLTAGEDFHEYWIDGVSQGSATASTAATDMWGVALCKNINKLADRAMELWWGRIRIYYSDPGW